MGKSVRQRIRQRGLQVCSYLMCLAILLSQVILIMKGRIAVLFALLALAVYVMAAPSAEPEPRNIDLDARLVGLNPWCIECMEKLCPEIVFGEWETCVACGIVCAIPGK